MKLEAIPERRGLCFMYACRYVIDNPEWTLHHGYLTGEAVTSQHDVRYDHAWAQLDDVVYEALADKHFLLVEYTSLCKPVTQQTFTSAQARSLAFGTGNYGPWTRQARRTFGK
jgi:hypothetical protein